MADSSVIHINMNSKILKINMHNLTLHEKFNKSRPMGIYPKNKWLIFFRNCVFEVYILNMLKTTTDVEEVKSFLIKH